MKCATCNKPSEFLAQGLCANCQKLEAFTSVVVESAQFKRSQRAKAEKQSSLMAMHSAVASFKGQLAHELARGTITHDTWDKLFDAKVKAEFKKRKIDIDKDTDGFYKAAVAKILADHKNYLGKPDSMVEDIVSSILEEFILLWLQPG